jgi:branched-chain amino acid aminotransferase
VTSWSWLDGVVGPTADARIPVTDHGLTVGDGIFETMKVVDGTPFALTRHLRRLRRSAASLALDIGLSDDDLRAACTELIAASGDDVGRMRLTVTGGPGPAGSERGTDGATVLVVTGPASTWPPTAAVAIVPFTRNPTGGLAGVKSTSYAENVLALARAHDAGASEAIFADVHGRLSEGTGSNVFVGRGGRLLTPSLATACLAGVTRELVLEACPDAVETDDLTLDDLRTADEAFLTSSTRDVQPIGLVDGTALAHAPGPLTEAAAQAFAALQARSLDP